MRRPLRFGAQPPFLSAPALGANLPWWADPVYLLDGTGPAVALDFENDRYAVPSSLNAAGVPAASVDQLTSLRSATFAEAFAFTCSGTVSRTRVNSSGVLVADGAVDTPRFDHATGSKRLLLENAATNLNPSSEDFTTNWAKTGVNVTANVITDPFGTTKADKITPTQASPNLYIVQSQTVVSGTNYCHSVYAKAGEQGWIQLCWGSTAFGNMYSNFDLVNGQMGTSTAPQAGMESLGNGWYRCWAAGPAIASSTSNASVLCMLNGDNGRLSNATVPDGEGLYVFGDQFETGYFPTSYIPTSGAAVTRPIESARLSPLVEAIFNRGTATARVQVTPIFPMPENVYRAFISTEKMYTRIGTSGAGGALAQLYDGTTDIGLALGSGSWTDGVGLVGAWDASGSILAANGALSSPTTAAPSWGNQWHLARGQTSYSRYGDGRYKSLVLWPFRAADASLPAKAVA